MSDNRPGGPLALAAPVHTGQRLAAQWEALNEERCCAEWALRPASILKPLGRAFLWKNGWKTSRTRTLAGAS